MNATQVQDTFFAEVHAPHAVGEQQCAEAKATWTTVSMKLRTWRSDTEPWTFMVLGVDANAQLVRGVERQIGDQALTDTRSLTK